MTHAKTGPAKRRKFMLGATAGAIALPAVWGCNADGDAGTETGGTDSSDAADSGRGSEASGTAGSGSTSTTGSDSADASGSGASSSGSGDGAPTGDGAEVDTGAVCDATDPDIEGPFYRPQIPVRSDLDLYDHPGDPLLLSGVVRAAGSCAPLEGVVVELWHALPRAPGASPGDVDATYDSSSEHEYYGQVATDADGRYSFSTLIPGWYLNGANYRPAHLHVKIWVGGQERLVTQLYFRDDPFNAADPWFNPDNALAPNGEGAATFDFVVDP